MTTVTCTYTREPGVPKPGLILFLALIAAVASLIGVLSQNAAPTVSVAFIKPIPPIVYEQHALKHGPDAVALR